MENSSPGQESSPGPSLGQMIKMSILCQYRCQICHCCCFSDKHSNIFIVENKYIVLPSAINSWEYFMLVLHVFVSLIFFSQGKKALVYGLHMICNLPKTQDKKLLTDEMEMISFKYSP